MASFMKSFDFSNVPKKGTEYTDEQKKEAMVSMFSSFDEDTVSDLKSLIKATLKESYPQWTNDQVNKVINNPPEKTVSDKVYQNVS